MYIVYKTTNTINGKFYIGVHNGKDPNYLGSGKYLNDAIAHYGRDSFERTTLYEVDTLEEALVIEAEIVNKDFLLREDTYNLTLGGGIPPAWGSTGPRPDASERMKRNNPVHDPEVLAKLKDRVTVKDSDGNTFSIKKSDPRYISGELVSVNKGRESKAKGVIMRQVECPHCKKIGRITGMKKWHFENCKDKL